MWNPSYPKGTEATRGREEMKTGCIMSVEEIEETTITPEDIERHKKRIIQSLQEEKK